MSEYDRLDLMTLIGQRIVKVYLEREYIIIQTDKGEELQVKHNNLYDGAGNWPDCSNVPIKPIDRRK